MSAPSTPRRRRSLRAERTSDVTRFRGVLMGAGAAAVTVLLAALLLTGDDARRGAPGPLPRPHAHAEVTCASCHPASTAAPPPDAACVACHGAHPPREPHRALLASGALHCADCHGGHRNSGGVTFIPDGAPIRWGTGAERALAVAGSRYRPVEAISVPIVAVAACARCHDPRSPRDPIATCLLAGQAALGDARPTVCFDEHQPVRAAGGALSPRSAAWDAAREVAAAAPHAPASSGPSSSPWLWLTLAAIAGVLGWGGVRAVDRARDRRAAVRAAASSTSMPAQATHRLPVIDTATCIGCYACVDACPFDVLEVRRYVAVVARPADCCGLTLCEQKCPNGSLVMNDRATPAPPTLIADSLESSRVPGLYLAGDVSGGALIRNAINQGALAIRHIATRVSRTPARAHELDVVIVGAGPAGLSAALEARVLGLRALALEQATVADSIRSFPRGKLVSDPDLPAIGSLWLAEATKEELLSRWTRAVREQRPAILEHHRVTAVRPMSGTPAGFAIDAIDAAGASTTRTAAHVLLAIGRRGSPRRLDVPIPAPLADHIHYSLADARSFAGRRTLVIGLGDVAMETAIALSRQPGATVTLSYRGPDFTRGKARNITEIRRRAAAGTIRLLWSSELLGFVQGSDPSSRVQGSDPSPRVQGSDPSPRVQGSDPWVAEMGTPEGVVGVACDSVFVMIGAIPGRELLGMLGLQNFPGSGSLQDTDPDAEAAPP